MPNSTTGFRHPSAHTDSQGLRSPVSDPPAQSAPAILRQGPQLAAPKRTSAPPFARSPRDRARPCPRVVESEQRLPWLVSTAVRTYGLTGAAWRGPRGLPCSALRGRAISWSTSGSRAAGILPCIIRPRRPAGAASGVTFSWRPASAVTQAAAAGSTERAARHTRRCSWSSAAPRWQKRCLWLHAALLVGVVCGTWPGLFPRAQPRKSTPPASAPGQPHIVGRPGPAPAARPCSFALRGYSPGGPQQSGSGRRAVRRLINQQRGRKPACHNHGLRACWSFARRAAAHSQRGDVGAWP